MMYWICQYTFTTFHQPSFWERLMGEQAYNISPTILIQADTKEEAEDKFHAYFANAHPGRKLIAWQVNETIV